MWNVKFYNLWKICNKFDKLLSGTAHCGHQGFTLRCFIKWDITDVSLVNFVEGWHQRPKAMDRSAAGGCLPGSYNCPKDTVEKLWNVEKKKVTWTVIGSFKDWKLRESLTIITFADVGDSCMLTHLMKFEMFEVHRSSSASTRMRKRGKGERDEQRNRRSGWRWIVNVTKRCRRVGCKSWMQMRQHNGRSQISSNKDSELKETEKDVEESPADLWQVQCISISIISLSPLFTLCLIHAPAHTLRTFKEKQVELTKIE